ncbi:protein of unknown function [Filimonas lacunae]|uniref:DUF4290 domain-containing protein n=1 Tax=Filimonas lacunae TaxID=477680 RepID=A0A173MR02_9BACT|nr:DUF4290 domain-containing protein [Filimonas lacunae]BAV09811.1 hypothetical protein FLA_5864 [Filimonas lacunae]SIS79307.1 protein of unknown function [Filimonas lacunae]
MEYNTTRNYLVMREYGRHIQKMVEHLLTLEDREERQQQTKVVIELMGFLNPHLKNVEDFRHMLWDHLFYISDFKLEVDSPYPIPTKETYKARPDPLPYPKRYPKYSHLGKNLETVIEKALNEEDPEKKAGFANTVAYYMKLAYSNWHKELVHDDAIRVEMNQITGGELEFSNTPYIKHRAPAFDRDDYPSRSNNRGGRQQQSFKSGGGRSNNNNNRNNGGGSNNRGNNGNGNNRNNNGGGGSNNRNNNNQNFKKRFK